jgi:hypothetical protein
MKRMEALRREYHQQLCEQIFSLDADGAPNNADKYSALSVTLAKRILLQLGFPVSRVRQSGQTSGKLFERVTASYLERAFDLLHHLRPGHWIFTIGKKIEDFEQYEHLSLLAETLLAHKELRATLGDYLINPDIVIGRLPVTDEEINKHHALVDTSKIAQHTPLRFCNSQKPILHASVSCKWTIRSDRSQNARTEGLNLIRNRKGKTPHIVIVTAEPYPQRIASLALGTGDIDCVYHFALPELQAAARDQESEPLLEMLDILISGKRLRDISDLPFDLAV